MSSKKESKRRKIPIVDGTDYRVIQSGFWQADIRGRDVEITFYVAQREDSGSDGGKDGIGVIQTDRFQKIIRQITIIMPFNTFVVGFNTTGEMLRNPEKTVVGGDDFDEVTEE